jgi:ABC-type transport system involved in Fe-S cluster assembly fused permease/ATPase subunit
MNDKTNFTGYSQTLGITSGNTTLTTNSNGMTNTYFDGNWATPLNGGSNYNSLSTLITNQNNMVKQVKVAVFTVERNKDNKVTSAKLVKELWVEVKNGTSLDLAVAKELDKDFDPSTTVVREIYSVTF